MKLTLAVLTCKQELLDSCLWHAVHYAEKPFHIVVIGQGFLPDLRHAAGENVVAQAIGLPGNIGVPRGLHALYKMCSSDTDVVCYLHDDVRVFERGWNTRVVAAFEHDSSVLLAGFSGTKGLGANFIYKRPYHLTQLSRQGPLLSNINLHAEFHGQRTTDEQEVAFVDGFSLALRRSFLDDIGGWSWWPFDCVHHAYDYGIACQVRRKQGKVWLVPVLCEHGVPDPITHDRHAGTRGSPIYQDLANQFGGDTEVHARGHRFVYDEFKDVLPIEVP